MSHKELDVFGVVLAGGSGTRFWPRSRQLYPKQLCRIADPEQTMLEQTLHRLDNFIPSERRIIVTHHLQEKLTRSITKSLSGYILAEPAAKNTAAALALAVLQIKLLSKTDDAVMVSLHADHLIKDSQAFQKTLTRAIAIARKGYISLIGIQPRYPETGFGYIEAGESLNLAAADGFLVKSFKEKPKLELAKQYVSQPNFYWNSGLFIWQISTICEEFSRYLPRIWNPLLTLYEQLKKKKQTFADLHLEELSKIYESLPEIAIDQGIFEKSKNIAVVDADFDWDDVGSWTALPTMFPADANGNVNQGNVLACETENSIIASDGPLVATYGVKDLIVVVDKGCVLVCHKDKAQGVKDIVAKLKETGRTDLI